MTAAEFADTLMELGDFLLDFTLWAGELYLEHYLLFAVLCVWIVDHFIRLFRRLL